MDLSFVSTVVPQWWKVQVTLPASCLELWESCLTRCSAQGSGTPAEKQWGQRGSSDNRLPLPKKIQLFLMVRELAVSS